jgi:hypothetical protein
VVHEREITGRREGDNGLVSSQERKESDFSQKERSGEDFGFEGKFPTILLLFSASCFLFLSSGERHA